MKTPSIKGSSISSLIEDIAKLAESGRISEELLAERLTPEDRALLRRPVNAAGWYDIHAYRRLTELICEVEGRREDLLRERGAAAARRLADAGIYQQMESVGQLREMRELSTEDRFESYGRALKLIATLSGSILNFGSWRVAVDPETGDRYQIEVSDAADFPEVLVFTSEGFINAMAGMGRADFSPDTTVWRHEWQSDDRFVFRMLRPV